ncbi:MAG: restriction endonuclease subunit M/S, partial [Nitrospiraceae bacterium]|nr:restriction endonuclease subunit M/S [Nitrospiraceae bacterium]
LAHVVKKEKIAENGDYNLSSNRYKEAIVYSGKWDFVELGEVCDFKNGLWKGKKEPLKKVSILRNTNFTKTGILDYSNVAVHPIEISQLKTRTLEYGDIILEKSGGGPTQPVGRVALFCKKDGQTYSYSNFTARIRVINESKINPIYLWRCLHYLYQQGMTKNCQNRTSGIRNLDLNAYKKMKIPLPPLEIQEQIVAELDNYQKIIDGARQVVENYKPTFKIDPEWEKVEIGGACEFNPKKSEVRNFADDLEVSFVPMADLNEHKMLFSTKQTKNKAEVYQGYTYFKENDVLLARVTPCFENGKSGIARNLKNGIGFGSSEYFVYRPKENILPEWIYYFISSLSFIKSGKNHMTGTGGLQRLTKDYATRYKIPLPPLEIQKQIVTQIEKEQKIINANKKLITIFENKIKDKIADVWGE